MKKLWILFALLFACGAEAEGYDDAEFGEVEQGMVAQATPTLSYGIRNSSDRSNCDRTTAGQSCLVPTSKHIKWCVSDGTGQQSMDGTTAARIARVSTETQRAINNAMTKFGWAFTHFADDSQGAIDACYNALIAGTVNVQVSLATSGLCSGSGGANIEQYICYNPTVGSTVTESLPGTYKTMSGGIVLVDFDDIIAKVTTTASTDKVLYHGMGHSFEGLIGLGSQTAASNLLSRRAVLPVSNTLGSSSSENCRALNFNVSSPSTFSLHPTLGCVEGP